MNKLAGKVVWVTGASSGIGEALAYAFARQKVQLVLSSRRAEVLRKVQEKCKKTAQGVEVLPMDVENTEEVQQKVEWVLNKFGSIHILVHCAGLSQRSFAKDTSNEVYRKIMEVNYFGTIMLSQAVLPYFLSQNQGQFVVMSSVTGKVGLPLRTAYSAAKHAVEGYFSALRAEIWQTNVKILMVRAGAVKTNIATNALTGDGSTFNKKDEIIENGISAESCAKEIVRAVLEDRKELMVGSAKEKLLFVINRFLPCVVFNFVKKLGNKG